MVNSNYSRGTKAIYDRVMNKTLDFFDDVSKYGLTTRDGQISMSSEIINALSESQNIIVEAGVGIGKSYAYLIPLIYLHRLTRRNIVISTSTIALQEQLMKDIEKLGEILGEKLDFILAKGKTNFLCFDRAVKSKLSFNIEQQDRKYYPDIKESDWKKICVEDCKFDACANKKNCDFYLMRRNMLSSDIIVCNHNLLIVDLLRVSGRSLLNNPEIIVCDEAHNLEDKFRDYFTKSINVKSILRDLGKLRGLHGDEIVEALRLCLRKLDLLFEKEIILSIKKLNEKGIDIVDCDELELNFNESIRNEIRSIISLLGDLEVRIFGGMQSITNQKEDIAEDILYNLLDLFNSFKDEENNIYWAGKSRREYVVSFVPKNIAKQSSSALTSIQKHFILTSATLSTVGGQYDYILNGLGLSDKNYTVAEPEESPYNYNDSMLYLCNELPNPKNKGEYLEELYKKIIQLIKLTNGKTLVLFTSKADMRYVYEKIKRQFHDINIYIQNNGSSQEEIKEKFKNDVNSVLLSTGTFWEGIDIKGESLSSIIIARLPFPVVTPYLEYKASIGGSYVYLNEMLIKLKQGCGRLVRSEDDKGLISILDSRVTRETYLNPILGVLPNYRVTTEMSEVEEYVTSNITGQKRFVMHEKKQN